MAKTKAVNFRLEAESYKEICYLVGARMAETGERYTISMWIRDAVEEKLDRLKGMNQEQG